VLAGGFFAYSIWVVRHQAGHVIKPKIWMRFKVLVERDACDLNNLMVSRQHASRLHINGTQDVAVHIEKTHD
jgi:hypothetical protein